MGIEYMIDYACRPKKELGEEHMLNLVKKAREQAAKRGTSELETAQYLEVPTGGDDEDAKLRKELSALDYYVSDCMSCPANASSDKTGAGPEAAFGCHMEIVYPISKHMETALLSAGMEALQNPTGNPGSKMVMGILRSHPKSKKTPAAQVRKMGRDYFESRSAKEIKVMAAGKQERLDTNHMMTLLMLGPVPAPATGAFATFVERGVERAKREGMVDPRVVAPLVMLAGHMRAAHSTGSAVKVKF